LSKKEYARKARYGYVNGREPVNYVRDIRQRFEAYVELSREVVALRRDPVPAPTPELSVQSAILPRHDNPHTAALRPQG
jgi:hypothetical protein